MPDNITLNETFGSYDLAFRIEDEAMYVHRSIKIHPVRVELDQYETLESFYKNWIAADQSSVVLERS